MPWLSKIVTLNVGLMFWKLNHAGSLVWDEGDVDRVTFTVVLAVNAAKLGHSSCFLSDRKDRKSILRKFNVDGHFTLKVLSQFDVATETGITGLTAGMPIMNTRSLRAHISANSHKPFMAQNLERILVTEEQSEHVDTENSSHASL